MLNSLFELDSGLATPNEITGGMKFVLAQGNWLTAQIDTANQTLSPLTSFILPTGTLAMTVLHLVHTITRLAEQNGNYSPPCQTWLSVIHPFDELRGP